MTADWKLRSTPEGLRQRFLADGWWTEQTLGQRLEQQLEAGRDLAFVFHSQTRPWRGTFGQVLDLARRVAGGLTRMGVRAGDVVSFQTPNWLEGAATFYGAALIGAVVVPIVHIYGSRELGYILRECQPRVHVTASRFGRQDFLANLESPDDIPGLQVVVIGDDVPDGFSSFDQLAAADPLTAASPADASAPALVGWTSGTTSNPKGVIHSHQTVYAEVRQLGATSPPGDRSMLVANPISHAIGMLSALLVPVDQGRPVHLLDQWDPEVVLQLMLQEDLTSGGGATYFVTSLLDHPSFGAEHLEHIRFQGMGGAPVPRAVTERLTALGVNVYRMYGSTEHPSITGCTYLDPLEKRLGTDGRPLPGAEIRLVDPNGADVGIGDPGQILSRGPECFLGYTDRELTERVFDVDGWYLTGDIGTVDEEGYLTITDRISDVIIRGGENISAAEVEEVLLGVPGIAEVAVVAAPDPRMGEHGAAVIRMSPGTEVPDISTLRVALEQAGLARQKWPEEVLGIDDFPRTPSGKIQKFVLRDRLRNSTPASDPDKPAQKGPGKC